MEKAIIKSFNFIRVFCALGIIVFHYSCHLPTRDFLPFHTFANGDWGKAVVAVFFILSGALLYYRYYNLENNFNLIKYFSKRWKTIFPMYYIAYCFFEIQNMIMAKSIFFRGKVFPYIYTLFGLDGYLSPVTTTYYIMGEWFTGAIILLYVLFPFLLCCFRKNSNITFGATLFLYILFLGKPIVNPEPYWSITSSLISFVFGMMLMKYRKNLHNIWYILLSIIGMLIIGFIKLPISYIVANHLMGLFLYGILALIGDIILKNNILDKIFSKLSSITYGIFLLQHIVILRFLNLYSPSNKFEILALLVAIILFVFFAAKLLTVMTNWIINKVEDVAKNKLLNRRIQK